MLADIIISTVVISLIAKLFENTIAKGAKARYFLLHSIVNIIVSILIFPDVYMGFTDPLIMYKKPLEVTLAYSIAIGLHLHHCLFYKLNSLDILHHVIMVGIATPYTLYMQPYIVSNIPLFMINGIPGAIDYFLLYLTEAKFITDPLIEKKTNVWLNSWLRGPISLIMVGMGYTSMVVNQRWECLPCLLFVAWNAVFFQNLTVSATYTKYGKQL